MLWVLVGCSDDVGPAKDATPVIAALGESHFQATALDTVNEVLRVRVTDPGGNPLAGRQVFWSTSDAGTLTPQTPTTDSGGTASAVWVLGWHGGTQSAFASVAGAADSATFSAIAVGLQAQALSTGDGYHQCAVGLALQLYCWGDNRDGALGDGTTTSSATPVLVQIPSPILQVVTTQFAQPSTCALTSAGQVYCWGGGAYGQLGNGSTVSSMIPVPPSLPPGVYTYLTAFMAGICALESGGDVYCWGRNPAGRFGAGVTAEVLPSPRRVFGGFPWRHFAFGDDRGCGVRDDGRVYCWGALPDLLGTGVDTNTTTPLPVLQSPLMDSVTLTSSRQCGITVAHETYCWGAGNLGLGPPPSTGYVNPVPTALAVPPALQSVQSNLDPTYGLGVDGKGYWWGPPLSSTGGGPFTPEAFSGDIPLNALGNGPCGIEPESSMVFCWGGFGWSGPNRVWAVPLP
jgi:hypothetical protein